MTRKRIFQAIGSVVTLVIIFIGCNDFGKVTEKTKEVAQEIIKNGRQAGIFEDDQSSTAALSKYSAQNTTNHQVHLRIPRSQSHIAIGTFNIQVFGVTKLRDENVAKILANIVRQFDCLAIQELRSKDDTVVDRFVKLVNSDGSRYGYVVGPRLGNRSTEQYVYLYDRNRVELVHQGFTVPDPQNRIHREPLVSLFRTLTADPRQSFRFALANVHVDPDETETELLALHEIYVWLQQYLRNEDDIILLGDFNEPPRRYGRIWQIPGLVAAVPDDVPTNTRKTKAYDNILLDRQFTHEFTGQAGVLDLQLAFDLTYEQARQVSDHLPVFALFHAAEIGPTQFATHATQPAVQQRSDDSR